jgi:hypothetical protein
MRVRWGRTTGGSWRTVPGGAVPDAARPRALAQLRSAAGGRADGTRRGEGAGPPARLYSEEQNAIAPTLRQMPHLDNGPPPPTDRLGGRERDRLGGRERDRLRGEADGLRAALDST